MTIIRALSYNMHKGFSIFNRRFVLAEMKDLLKEQNLDLVFLQEVLGAHSRHFVEGHGSSQFEFLADQVWSHYAYGKNAVYDEGHHGNALLSKFPITHWSNFDLSTNYFEQRGLLHAKIEILPERRVLHCFSVHLSLFTLGRRKQLSAIAERISSMLDPGSAVIIAGDFNDWRQEASSHIEHALGVKEAFKSHRGTYARSFPGIFPLLRLDRIYYRGMKPISATVLSGKKIGALSDHRPLLVEFELSR